MATTYTPLLELPKHDTTDPFDITKINDMADLVDAGMAKAYRGKAAHNLLDNSDFLNPVNQRGQTTYTGQGAYTIDRWKQVYNGSSVTVTDGGLTVTPGTSVQGWIRQLFEKALPAGLQVTLYVELADESVDVITASLTEASAYRQGKGYTVGFNTAGIDLVVQAGDPAVTFRRVALYKGNYNADTVPEYQPKGYAAELMECMRYYQTVYRIYGASVGNLSREAILLRPRMRVAPTVTKISGWEGITGAGYAVQSASAGFVDIQYTGWGNVSLALSADL